MSNDDIKATFKQIDSSLASIESSTVRISASLERIEARVRKLPTTLQFTVIYAAFVAATVIVVYVSVGALL